MAKTPKNTEAETDMETDMEHVTKPEEDPIQSPGDDTPAPGEDADGNPVETVLPSVLADLPEGEEPDTDFPPVEEVTEDGPANPLPEVGDVIPDLDSPENTDGGHVPLSAGIGGTYKVGEDGKRVRVYDDAQHDGEPGE